MPHSLAAIDARRLVTIRGRAYEVKPRAPKRCQDGLLFIPKAYANVIESLHNMGMYVYVTFKMTLEALSPGPVFIPMCFR